MQQRVAIARGLASKSELLLLDKPLAAVDARTRADMQDLLLELAERFGQTCILVTHDVDEAVYMADRVVVLTCRPTRVDIVTHEEPRFLAIRHDVMAAIRRFRAQTPLNPSPEADVRRGRVCDSLVEMIDMAQVRLQRI